MTLNQPNTIDADLTDARTFQNGPPHAVFAALREHEPVKWQPAAIGTPTGGFWALTRYDDIEMVSKDKDNFTVHSGCVYPSIDRHTMSTSMMFNDAPVHTRLRRIATKSFTPRVIARFQGWVKDIVDETLDRIQDMDEFDFVEEIAAVVPGLVIADVVGVPRDMRQSIATWANNMVEAMINSPNDPTGTARAAKPVFDYGFELRELKRREPAADMVTELINSPEQLTDAEYKDYFILLVSAGFETTYTMMAQGMREIVEDDHIARQVAAACEKGDATPAVDEILRYSSPVMEMARSAKKDMVLSGQHITAGEMLVMWYVSANRDPAVFDNPNVFDASRSPNPHMGFGAGGPHFCLGAPLARLEGRLLLQGMHERGMKFRLAGEPERHANPFMNRMHRLPLARI